NGQLWDTTEGSCKALSEGDYVLGIINNRNIWSEKKLTNFKGEYKNKYSEIKDFFIQKTNDFGFIIKEVETEKTLFDGQRNIPRGVNVYAETTPIDILDKNANITGSSINVIVW
ncbi:hypothetical protein HYW74_04080, partial [Candidatus Pacearchaeota archaeon]|nr:hypothetical protein [Candidatus Pacearchaeota archaeon]